MNLTITICSFVLSIILLLIEIHKKKRVNLKPILYFILVLIPVLLYGFLSKQFSSGLIPKGDDTTSFLPYCILLGSVVLGMFFQYLFSIFSIPAKERPKFDFGVFLAPIFISPIIIVPLYGTMANSSIDVMNINESMMLYLVAFENGFFWQALFTSKRKKISEG